MQVPRLNYELEGKPVTIFDTKSRKLSGVVSAVKDGLVIVRQPDSDSFETVKKSEIILIRLEDRLC